MIVHNLDGCAPTPLAHYLKALGILRILAEQDDSKAHGWWQGERFRLATKLDRREIQDFFLERYEPTPMFNPWGGRSGFYPGSAEKRARNVLESIERSQDSRLNSYRKTVEHLRQVIQRTTGGKKPGNEQKEHLIMALRREVRGKALLWLDAVAVVIGSGHNLNIEHPALFGTGGNEGSGSYTSAYMTAIDQCIVKRQWDHSLPVVLFGEYCSPGCRWDQSVGQFVPEGTVTPWDLLLAFEGACMLRSAVNSRNSTESNRWMSSPFFVAPTSYGYPSEATLDEYTINRGSELPGRGEQWFPLWAQPIAYNELSQVFVEGRATTKRHRVTDGWSMLRAVTSFGVRQGISGFVRYGYQQRNNLATHFAVPLGRFRVPERRSPTLACLDDLDNWLPTLRRQARTKEAPARLRLAERRLCNILFKVTQYPDVSSCWQSVLLALGTIEAILRTGTGLKAGPVPSLRPEWVKAADDGSSEFRLAVACALQAAQFYSSGLPYDPVRRHWLPLDGKRFATSVTGSQTRIVKDAGVVMSGRGGIEDAIALVERRIVEASQNGKRLLPLVAARHASAHAADLAGLVAGKLDMDRILQLTRALMAIDHRKWASNPCPPKSPIDSSYPDDGWLAVRLALLPFPLTDELHTPIDPAIIRRLRSGNASAAVKIALQRLRAMGINTTLRFAAATPQAARQWAAALAFPIAHSTAVRFLHRLDPDNLKEKTR